jgi:hypothetical protein
MVAIESIACTILLYMHMKVLGCKLHLEHIYEAINAKCIILAKNNLLCVNGHIFGVDSGQEGEKVTKAFL